ncbi:hypothetical protein BD324DRAFT_622014 [Kockovaella imperatae]|uniref:Uncharacterized protein n=1 Tax=Kockovaella imperatae TaxID=4999 RepID=A0A1Y1UKX8_9TREE|nr:hypothetical protein BD324DRAFT_622014 [Kockovaella imperatae]ORX38710.1 hypothetical protein BD324DRAFT_622014 [Kockovaella imperatae]
MVLLFSSLGRKAKSTGTSASSERTPSRPFLFPPLSPLHVESSGAFGRIEATKTATTTNTYECPVTRRPRRETDTSRTIKVDCDLATEELPEFLLDSPLPRQDAFSPAHSSTGTRRAHKLRKGQSLGHSLGYHLFGGSTSPNLIPTRLQEWVILPRSSSLPPTPTTSSIHTMGQNQTKTGPVRANTASQTGPGNNVPEQHLFQSKSCTRIQPGGNKVTLPDPPGGNKVKLPDPPGSAAIRSTHSLPVFTLRHPKHEDPEDLNETPTDLSDPSSSHLFIKHLPLTPPPRPPPPSSSYRPPLSFAPKTKNLSFAHRLGSRRGSQRRRPHTADASISSSSILTRAPTLSEDLATFEAAILSAESRAGQRGGDGLDPGEITSGSDAQGRRRSEGVSTSNPGGEPAPPSKAGPRRGQSPPLGHASSTLPTRNASLNVTNRSSPLHHRRKSSSSVISSKSSIKSSRRAEMEWRARVAALSLAHSSGPGSPGLSQRSSVPGRDTIRGPVPPKRIKREPSRQLASQVIDREHDLKMDNAHADTSFGSSIDSERVITPRPAKAISSTSENNDHLSESPVSVYSQVSPYPLRLHYSTALAQHDVGSPRTPAKSFRSGHSFDTLGFHRPDVPPPPPSVIDLNLTPKKLGDSDSRSKPSSRQLLSPGHEPTTTLKADRMVPLVDEDSTIGRDARGDWRLSVPLSVSSMGRSISSFYFDGTPARGVKETLKQSTATMEKPEPSVRRSLHQEVGVKVECELQVKDQVEHEARPKSLGSTSSSVPPPPGEACQPATRLDVNFEGIEELVKVNSAAEFKASKMVSSLPDRSRIEPIRKGASTPGTKAKAADSADKNGHSSASASTPIKSPHTDRSARSTTTLEDLAAASSARQAPTPITPSIQRSSHVIRMANISSPYSPTTTYLLTAPIESLPWHLRAEEAEDTPPKSRDGACRAHPFASTSRDSTVDVTSPLVPAELIPRPPRAPSPDVFILKTTTTTGEPTHHAPQVNTFALRARRRVPAPIQVIDPARISSRLSNKKSNSRLDSLRTDGPTQGAASHHLSMDAASASSNRLVKPVPQPSAPPPPPPPSSRALHAHNHANHRSKIPSSGSAFKSQILGTTAPAKRHERTDLTPGMESGQRPPKTGLPMADLQQWLRDTSIGA